MIEKYIICSEIGINKNTFDCSKVLNNFFEKTKLNKNNVLIIYFPDGLYKFRSELKLISNIHLLGNKKTYFDFSEYKQHEKIKLYNFRNFYIKGSGEVIETIKIEKLSDIKKYEHIDYDLIEFFDPDINWDIHFPHPQGEIHKKNQFKNLFYNYNNLHINLIKSIKNITISNIHFIGLSRKNASLIGINIIYGENINICNNTLYKFDYISINIRSCLEIFIYNNEIFFEDKGNKNGIQYAINFQNSSRNGYVYKNKIYKGKHSLLTGHIIHSPGIQRDIYYVNNECYLTWHAAMTNHNACEKLNYFNNITYKCKFGINNRVNECVFFKNKIFDSHSGFYLSKSCKNMISYKNLVDACSFYLFVNEINKPFYKNQRFNNLFYKNKISNCLYLLRIYDNLKTNQYNYLFFDNYKNIKRKDVLEGKLKIIKYINE